MERYINADKTMEEIERIGGHNLCEWETIGVKALIDRQPTADIVPKSEVEELLTRLNNAYEKIDMAEDDVERLEQENEALKDTNEHLAVLLAEAKSEVASEIFAEIENALTLLLLSVAEGREKDGIKYRQLHDGRVLSIEAIRYFIAELKNKYTEGTKNE